MDEKKSPYKSQWDIEFVRRWQKTVEKRKKQRQQDKSYGCAACDYNGTKNGCFFCGCF